MLWCIKADVFSQRPEHIIVCTTFTAACQHNGRIGAKRSSMGSWELAPLTPPYVRICIRRLLITNRRRVWHCRLPDISQANTSLLPSRFYLKVLCRSPSICHCAKFCLMNKQNLLISGLCPIVCHILFVSSLRFSTAFIAMHRSNYQCSSYTWLG